MLCRAPHIRYHIAAILAAHWLEFVALYKRWIRLAGHGVLEIWNAGILGKIQPHHSMIPPFHYSMCWHKKRCH